MQSNFMLCYLEKKADSQLNGKKGSLKDKVTERRNIH